MALPRVLRKCLLAAHIASSVGWLGAIAAYMPLAIVGLNSDDPLAVRFAYFSMEQIGWFVIVPLSIGALATGLVQSLATPWGLLRHYWIVAKFAVTVGAALILLKHMQAVSSMSRSAADTLLAAGDLHTLRLSLVVHPSVALLVLLVPTTLSVFKPWGLTPYGRRKRDKRTLRAESNGEN